jgi:hypothetical protein
VKVSGIIAGVIVLLAVIAIFVADHGPRRHMAEDDAPALGVTKGTSADHAPPDGGAR